MNDPYSVLGIRPDASDEEVKRAYRQLAREYHPDHVQDGAMLRQAEERMKEINDAHEWILAQRAGEAAAPKVIRPDPQARMQAELDGLSQQGYAALSEGRFDEAREHFQRMLQQDESRYDAYWGLLLSAYECDSSDALSEQGRCFEQEADFRNALKYAPLERKKEYARTARQAQRMCHVHVMRELRAGRPRQALTLAKSYEDFPGHDDRLSNIHAQLLRGYGKEAFSQEKVRALLALLSVYGEDKMYCAGHPELMEEARREYTQQMDALLASIGGFYSAEARKSPETRQLEQRAQAHREAVERLEAYERAHPRHSPADAEWERLRRAANQDVFTGLQLNLTPGPWTPLSSEELREIGHQMDLWASPCEENWVTDALRGSDGKPGDIGARYLYLADYLGGRRRAEEAGEENTPPWCTFADGTRFGSFEKKNAEPVQRAFLILDCCKMAARHGASSESCAAQQERAIGVILLGGEENIYRALTGRYPKDWRGYYGLALSEDPPPAVLPSLAEQTQGLDAGQIRALIGGMERQVQEEKRRASELQLQRGKEPNLLKAMLYAGALAPEVLEKWNAYVTDRIQGHEKSAALHVARLAALDERLTEREEEQRRGAAKGAGAAPRRALPRVLAALILCAGAVGLAAAALYRFFLLPPGTLPEAAIAAGLSAAAGLVLLLLQRRLARGGEAAAQTKAGPLSARLLFALILLSTLASAALSFAPLLLPAR